jgi:hypothetical protein
VPSVDFVGCGLPASGNGTNLVRLLPYSGVAAAT